MGGKEISCGGCHTLKVLHDDDMTCVEVDECPNQFNYNQEAFILDWFNHYSNQNSPTSPLDFPQWIKEGIITLSHIRQVEDSKKHGK